MDPPTKQTGKRTFSNDDELALIAYWGNNYAKYSNTSAATFAKEACEYLNNEVFPSTSNRILCTVKQVQGKLDTLLKKYKQIRDMYDASGIGLESAEETDIKLPIERQMKNFFRVHRFLGSKNNITPPIIMQTVRGGVKPLR